MKDWKVQDGKMKEKLNQKKVEFAFTQSWIVNLNLKNET